MTSALELPRRSGREDVNAILRRLERKQGNRSHWEQHWEELAEYIWPDKNDFPSRRTWQPGQKRMEKVFDATAPLALEKFAAVMESLLTPRQQKWHSLRASEESLNDDADVKEWFELVTKTLFAARQAPQSGFYSQVHESYKSLGCFGSQVLNVTQAPSGRGLRYQHIHIGQVFPDTDPIGHPDTLYRVYKLTAKQAQQRWEDKLPQRVAQATVNDPEREFDFVHYVVPRENVEVDRLDTGSMRFRSLHISMEDRELIDEGGFNELPYMFSRWTVNPLETYGRSQGMLVLPSIKTVNEMMKTFLRAGHKAVDPPLLAPQEGVLGAGARVIRLTPGGITYGGADLQGRQLIHPLETGANLPLAEGMIQKEREVINEAFFDFVFRLIGEERHPQRTATEIIEMAQKEGMRIGPPIGRQQTELLGPLIQREVNMLLRQGAVPPPPESLLEAGGDYEIEYVSQATRMQRSEELVGIQRTVEMAAPFAALDPKIMLKFNAEEIINVAAEINGAPAKMIRDDDEYAELRDALAQAEQQAAQVEQLKGLAQAAQAGAGAIGTVSPNGA